jgi:hypothetical protein
MSPPFVEADFAVESMPWVKLVGDVLAVTHARLLPDGVIFYRFAQEFMRVDTHAIQMVLSHFGCTDTLREETKRCNTCGACYPILRMNGR